MNAKINSTYEYPDCRLHFHTLRRVSYRRQDECGHWWWVTFSACSCGRYGRRHASEVSRASSASRALRQWKREHVPGPHKVQKPEAA